METTTDNKQKTRILLEMRPALEGFAGIPQEVRLLFRGLSKLDSIELEGMIQTSHRTLARGTKEKLGIFESPPSETKKINRYSRVIVSMAEKPYRTIADIAIDFIEKRLSSISLTLSTLLGFTEIKLTKFESKYFEDFTWRTMFAKTLPASDFDLVSKANHRICSTSWHTMHMVGLNTLSVHETPRYGKLDTGDFDIFIGQTPYPAQIHKKTAFIVRYHDAIPVLMPHTISDKSIHQATHFYALMSNVRNGAWFSCVSEATRQDLIKLFPEAEKRSITIHNMVSHHYFNENSSFDLVPGIIRSRLYANDPDAKDMELFPKFLTIREQESFFTRVLNKGNLKYLLIVSTIEPRKNHTRLLAAWEVIKAEIDPEIKLVIVGTLGWDYKQIVKGLKTWIDRGELFMLNAVPAPDLRTLYHHAAATVCPSLGEGFDFSGAESMASGGVTIASDIPVHREVYDDAAEYFDPYSTASLVKALKKVLYSEDSVSIQEQMRIKGAKVAERYQPDQILPQWENFLNHVIVEKR
jgi:glycosyltransferase involved in cell wall biosynthesis